MTTIERVTFDPDAQHQRPATRFGAERFPMFDLGARAVLVWLLMLFVGPLVLFGLSGRAGTLAGTGIELKAVLWVALLSLLLPLIQIFVHIRRFGGSLIRGNRQTYPVSDGVAGRIVRAHANLIESLVPFAAAVGVTQILNISTNWTVAATYAYLAARIIHALTYVLGITVIRSAAFYAGVLATVIIACQAPLVL